MIITDILYDLTVGVIGAVIGAFVIGMLGHVRTRRLSRQIVTSQRDLDAVRLENDRLLDTIRQRENEILSLQKKILKRRPQK